ncbi:uncharacterized protein B0I36DRAFT_329819 [Microdochium trichocladiopsis]|uniref:GST C-terminal domain-containing protein n=1 Tax=Microdochium trichocladiopsis TaxID=1682393 RepID=A0A9P8Y111_9PEZI|nr:uncharacterized protein B0I36DRAFT_329819 [Microdochium trichocladiopsis]KAH7026071.1 hypothetical protein B0I36DRAFT_329819 [Microdochium trichocladiopsis]
MAVQDLPIVLYTYDGSPYGRRLVWYLNLRKIPFKTCHQPPILPRPDLQLLGLSYRRIPLLAIGRDVYLDTRLIIAKLEQLYPTRSGQEQQQYPGISPQTPEHRALQQLLSRHVNESPGALFGRAAQLMPADSPALRNEHFVRDRNQLVTGKPDGKAFSPASLAAARPAALVEIARFVELLEGTLLADGRDWVFGGQGPSLGDIEAVFVLHWLTTMPGALPAEVVGAGRYPKTFAWIARFDQFVKKSAAKPDVVKGQEAASIVLGAEYAEEPSGGVQRDDPVIAAAGFQPGDVVTMWPVDQAPVNKDSGTLVKMDGVEVVIEVLSKDGKAVRVHAPRHGFKVVKGSQAGAKM